MEQLFLVLLVFTGLHGSYAKNEHNIGTSVTILPPHRITNGNPLHLRIIINQTLTVHILLTAQLIDCNPLWEQSTHKTDFRDIILIDKHKELYSKALEIQHVDVSELCGIYLLNLSITTSKDNTTVLLFERGYVYEVFNSGVNSSRLIDGAFIEFLHWSEDEGKSFNPILQNMSAKDWIDQLHFMYKIGIKNVIIQSVFLNEAYPNRNTAFCHNFTGQSLYPSKIFPKKYPLFYFDDDKLDIVLRTAEELNMTVWIGIGLFEWFAYGNESVCWANLVISELWTFYGKYSCLYGWYISSEMAGDLDYHSPFFRPGIADEMRKYFIEIRHLLLSLPAATTASNSPNLRLPAAMPLMLAINSENIFKFSLEWLKILPFVDVVSVFGFSRLPFSPTPEKMKELCESVGSELWIDMELFQDDISHGLLPKNHTDIIAEIRKYDAAVSIGAAYEFTGLMDAPESVVHLGGKLGVQAYNGYKNYYERTVTEYIHKCAVGAVLANQK